MERLPGDGWREALDFYKRRAADLHAGRPPRETGEGLTVARLCNRRLAAKQHALEAGEITAATWREYKRATDGLVSQFGGGRLADDLAAADFESLRARLSKRLGPVRLGNEYETHQRLMAKYGYR